MSSSIVQGNTSYGGALLHSKQVIVIYIYIMIYILKAAVLFDHLTKNAIWLD